jgi:hypothetical protein
LIHCDSYKINQVIHNLLDNAIKFTSQGTITISAARFSENSVIIKIADSGTGIDSTIIEKLFEKFSSRSQSGTGLGLYIAKKIVECHAGRIWAQNNSEGNGAIFSFTLPRDLRQIEEQPGGQSSSSEKCKENNNNIIIDILKQGSEGNNTSIQKTDENNTATIGGGQESCRKG